MQGGLKDGPVPDEQDAVIHAPRYRAIVVGYGPVGQTVARLLRDNEVEPTVIEMNIATVRSLRSAGITAVYGDASHLDTLKGAGVEGAVTLVLSTAGMHNAAEVIRLARELNPNILIYARTLFLGEIDTFCSAGADAVFSGEGEVALTMTEFVLRQLGATAEQIDRERDRVRMELLGRTSSSCSL
jgi:CPA2 family monovalent cation:H+ antiporter-2